jgi:hypothetical protein
VTVNTDAILFYGSNLDDCEEEGLPQVICDHLKIDHDDSEEVLNKMWELSKELTQSLGIEIRRHCMETFPIYYMMISGTKTLAGRGHPEKIDPAALNTTKIVEWDNRLVKAADLIGWPREQLDTGWWMASWWSE